MIESNLPDRTQGDDREKRALVALSLVSGLGATRVRSLVTALGSAMAVFDASAQRLARIKGVGPQTAAAIRAFDAYDQVDAQFHRAAQVGASLITLWDEDYPYLLRQIFDPPVFLWCRGEGLKEFKSAVAIVGTRKPSEYGRRAAHDFGVALARQGITVVSGLAYGIDAAAHRGALEAGGKTIAVLGSGVDRIYPARHNRLVQDILKKGAVLSEYELGAAPDAPNFPKRNRIISGLSLGTLIVEAFETGGALITARLALEQNREVFAVPSSCYNAHGIGTNKLIQQGYAKLVLSVQDILNELDHPGPSPSTSEPTVTLPKLNGVERTLLQVLSDEPKHIDLICQDTGLEVSTVLVYLLSLEFKGLICQLGGKQFYRC